MASPILAGLELVELSAFVAAPLAGLALAQMGAEVIRIDQTGGGPDRGRWPLGPDGTSLYWQGLNKAKRSVELDLHSEAGRRDACDLVVRTGMVVTNRPDIGWLDHAALARRRPDLVMLTIGGTHDGRPAVDYTVQARTGLPFITGDARPDRPVNQVLPAWDTVCGLLAALGLLAADRRRRATGEGSLIRLALADCALWMLGNLGLIAEAALGAAPRQPAGNDIFGAFGTDFGTADGRRVMVGALTGRQWQALVAATGTGAAMAHLAAAFGADLATDAGRYAARAPIRLLLEPWFAARPLAEAGALLDRHRVLWGPYQTLAELVRDDPACSPQNPMVRTVTQRAGGTYPTPALPLDFGPSAPAPALARLAPLPGADTAAVLSGLGPAGPRRSGPA